MSKKTKRILLVSASEIEMLSIGNPAVDMLVTSVGMVATSHALTLKLLESTYDLVVNIGIAGSFNSSFQIGAVAQVVTDKLVELGAEDNGSFIPANEMNLIESNQMIFKTGLRVLGLLEASGITVNRVHGSANSIMQVKGQFNPDIESMEGAAVAYVCEQMNVPWVQIRAISNLVEPRNKDAWNIPLALKNLHKEVESYLTELLNEA
jgi:futalosine hydrolase